MTNSDRTDVATIEEAASSAPTRAALSQGWVAAVDQLRARRATRTARKRLERELASYSTPAERLELDAMLARYEAAEVADIHRMIDRRRAA